VIDRHGRIGEHGGFDTPRRKLAADTHAPRLAGERGHDRHGPKQSAVDPSAPIEVIPTDTHSKPLSSAIRQARRRSRSYSFCGPVWMPNFIV